MQLKRALISSGTLLALTASLTLGGAVTPASPAIWSKKRDLLVLLIEFRQNHEVDVVGYDGKLKGRKSGAYAWIGSKRPTTSLPWYLGLNKKWVISPSCVIVIWISPRVSFISY